MEQQIPFTPRPAPAPVFSSRAPNQEATTTGYLTAAEGGSYAGDTDSTRGEDPETPRATQPVMASEVARSTESSTLHYSAVVTSSDEDTVRGQSSPTARPHHQSRAEFRTRLEREFAHHQHQHHDTPTQQQQQPAVLIHEEVGPGQEGAPQLPRYYSHPWTGGRKVRRRHRREFHLSTKGANPPPPPPIPHRHVERAIENRNQEQTVSRRIRSQSGQSQSQAESRVDVTVTILTPDTPEPEPHQEKERHQEFQNMEKHEQEHYGRERRLSSGAGTDHHLKYGKNLDHLHLNSARYDADDEEDENAAAGHWQRFGQRADTRNAEMRERDMKYTKPFWDGVKAAEASHSRNEMQMQTFVKPASFPLYQNFQNPADHLHHSPLFAGVSPSGNLKIHPKSVLFENSKVAVLVADPRKSRVIVKQIKGSGVHENVMIMSRNSPFPADYHEKTGSRSRTHRHDQDFKEFVHKQSQHSKLQEKAKFGSDDGGYTQLFEEKLRIGAAVLIQARVRGWLTKRWYQKVRSAVVTIQIAYRLHKERQHSQAGHLSLHRSNNLLGLQFLKATVIPGPPVLNLKLEGSDSVILLGGSNPLKGLGDYNTGREIYQLHPSENMWSKMGHIPEPRVQGGAVLYAGNIVFFGGADPRFKTSRDKNVPCAATWCLKVTGGNWRRLASMRTPRSNFGYILSHRKIWVFGGIDIDGNALTSCEMYDPDANTWTEITPMDGPRLGMAVAKYADKIWIIGGLTKNPKVPLLRSVIVYHVKKNIFTPAPAYMYARAFATATTFYTKIFLFAGAGKIGPNKSRSLDDVSIYEKGHWESIGRLRTPRHGHCQLRLGKYVLILGGINSTTQDPLDTCEVFNMIKYTVSTKVAPLPKPIVGCCGIVI